MGNLLLSALDWSEVWALLIPLLVLLFHPKQPNHLKPVIIYLWLALLLNSIIDLLWVFKIYLPDWLRSNNPVYNIHSVARFICFSFFFIHYPKASFVKLKKLLAAASLAFLFINFLFTRRQAFEQTIAVVNNADCGRKSKLAGTCSNGSPALAKAESTKRSRS